MIDEEELYIVGCKYCGHVSARCTVSVGLEYCENYVKRRQIETERFTTATERLTTTKETVNHPAHYGGDTTYEVIKVLEVWMTEDEFRGFCKGNAIKYEARHLHKGGQEDLAKAEWYMHYWNEYVKRRAAK